jgi:hypothetical protein
MLTALTNAEKLCKITGFPRHENARTRQTRGHPLQAKKYGTPEIAAIAASAVVAALIIIVFAPRWFMAAAVFPVAFGALVAAYGYLSAAWKTWKRAAEYAVMPLGWVFLTLAFWLGVGLTALIARIFGVKMLDTKFEDRKTYWVEKPRKEATLENAERQF